MSCGQTCCGEVGVGNELVVSRNRVGTNLVTDHRPSFLFNFQDSDDLPEAFFGPFERSQVDLSIEKTIQIHDRFVGWGILDRD